MLKPFLVQSRFAWNIIPALTAFDAEMRVMKMPKLLPTPLAVAARQISLIDQHMTDWFQHTSHLRNELIGRSHTDLGRVTHHYQHDGINNEYFRTNLVIGKLEHWNGKNWYDVGMYGPLDDNAIVSRKVA